MKPDAPHRNKQSISSIPAPVSRVVVATIASWFETLSGPSLLGLFRELSTCGCYVNVVLPSSRNISIKDGSFSAVGFKVRRYVPILTLLSFYRVVLKTAVRERCTTLIFDFRILPVFIVCKILLKSKGICLISSRPVGVGGFRGWLRLLQFQISLLVGRSLVETFTAVSPFEATAFSRLGGIPRAKLLVVPSPLGEPFVRFSSHVNLGDMRSRLGHNDLIGKKLLLYHGSFHKERDIMRVLEVFIESFGGDDRMVLLLVGSGPSRDSMKNLIQREASNVLLWEPVAYSELPDIIACCDAGLVWLPDHPWWRYQCPTKLIELLALGKPVVVSDLPGIRWIAGDSPLVVYLKSLDVDEFKNAVRKAARDRDDFTRSEQVRRDMIERFSTKSIARQLRPFIH